MADDSELFDPATRERIRTEHGRGEIAVFAVLTLFFALVTGAGHNEAPFLARAAGACSPDDFAYECPDIFNFVAGVSGLVLFGAVSAFAYRYRRFVPTVRCLSCHRRGWVMDLEPREGRCPRCAGSRFSYRTHLTGGGPLGPWWLSVDEPDEDGAALVRRYRETRRNLLDHRYY